MAAVAQAIGYELKTVIRVDRQAQLTRLLAVARLMVVVARQAKMVLVSL